MKKLLLSAAFAVLGLASVKAQKNNGNEGFSKGDIFVMGSAQYSSTSSDGISADSFTIAPNGGYFITEKIALGLGLSYSSAVMEVEGEDMDVDAFGGGVFGRYYFNPENKFSFLAGLSLGYSTMDMAGVDMNSFSVAVAPGVSYFLSNHIAIEANVGVLGYSSTKMDVDGAEAINQFSVGLSSTDITFGIIYKF